MDEYPILDNKWSEQELVLITGALIKMNRSELALDVLRNQFQEPNRNRLNRVAAESARLGNVQVALGILDIAKHFNMDPDVITYTSAIHACARGGRSDVPMALQLLNKMIQDGITPNHRTYGAAVLAYARMNRWEEIEELMDTIPYTDDGNKSEVFASAIITCTRNRQYLFATRLFQMLLDQGIYPGDNLCNAALSACARTSDLHHLNIIFRLIEKHATPTIYTFNSMISAYGNARDMDEAMHVYAIMKERGVQPDVVTFNALLLGAVRSRRVDMLPQLLSMMDEEGAKWDVYTLNMLLEGCLVAEDAEQAEKYWDCATASHKGNKKNKKNKVKGDSSVAATSLATQAQEQEAQLQDVRLDRTHFETLMGVYFAAKQFDKLITLWRENYVCRRRTKSSKALNFLIRACKETADDATAMALIDEFVGRGHVVSSVTHNHLLATLLAADKYPLARAHLRKMDNDGLATTFSFTLLMKHLLKRSNSEDKTAKASEAAHEVLELFKMYIYTRNGHPKWNTPLLHFPTDALYVIATRAAKQVGAHEDLLGIYSECPATMSMAVKKEIVRLVIESCDAEGDWKTAVLLYDELTNALDTDTNIALYEKVVKIVARAGEFEKALDVNGGDWYRLNRTDKGWGF